MINSPLLVVYGTSGDNLLSFIGDTAGESRKFALGRNSPRLAAFCARTHHS